MRTYTLKVRGGSETYVKRDGTMGTAGKGALVGDDVSFTVAATQDQVLVQPDKYIVRRLTPRECERLQGFPDDWTLIPYRGKPAENCPDGPRYKALGNSMAVPVMKWIGERIQMVEEILKEIPERRAAMGAPTAATDQSGVHKAFDTRGHGER